MQTLLKKSRWLLLSSIAWMLLAQCIGVTDFTYAAKQNNAVTEPIETVTKINAQGQKNNLMLEYDLYFSTKLAIGVTLGMFIDIIGFSMLGLFDNIPLFNLLHDPFIFRFSCGLWLALLAIVMLIDNKSKAYIICESDKITLLDTIIPLQNIKFASITMLNNSIINKMQLHVGNPNGIYVLEYRRMKNLLSTLKLIQFLKKGGISVVYNV